MSRRGLTRMPLPVTAAAAVITNRDRLNAAIVAEPRG